MNRNCKVHYECYGHVTVRERQPYDQPVPFWATGHLQKIPRYVVVDADDPGHYLGGFGMVDGGPSKKIAVFWAERFASKNGYTFIRPKGWEKIEGELPNR